MRLKIAVESDDGACANLLIDEAKVRLFPAETMSLLLDSLDRLRDQADPRRQN